MSTEKELMRFLSIVQKMLLKHNYTIEVLTESLGDTAIVALASAQKCDKHECNNAATTKKEGQALHLCDRHLAEGVIAKSLIEEEWKDLHHAECVRGLHDYITAREAHEQQFALH